MTCTWPKFGSKASTTFPLASVTRRMPCGLTRNPPLSNAEYAARCSAIEIASWPSVVDTPAGFSILAVTPRLCSRDTTRSPPSCEYVHSAGKLRVCVDAGRGPLVGHRLRAEVERRRDRQTAFV